MVNSLTQLFRMYIMPATLRPCDPATLRPCDPATLRPCDPATLRPCDPAKNVSRSRYALILALLTGSAPALAAVVPPYDQHVSVNVSYDKNQLPPADISGGISVFWLAEGGHDGSPDDARRWGWNTWLCLSLSDPTFGACPTVPTVKYTGKTSVRLRLTEQRSKATAIVFLTGDAPGFFHNNGSICSEPSYNIYGMHNALGSNCYGIITNGRKLRLWINRDSLQNLPTGGIWKGTLKLNETHWETRATLAVFTADITLDMTDRNNGQIYLPAFGSATPLVDLNLRTRPLSTAPGGQVSGSTTIDTCLYDGYNSNSSWLSVTLSDTANAPGRGADIFSVVKEGAGQADARNRVDYRVTLHYNGQARKMENGKALRLSSANTATIRPVALPGYPVPVVCIPAPLALDVEPFAKASKTAGRYSGTLKINLAAEALAP